jgi:hypothetical protein
LPRIVNLFPTQAEADNYKEASEAPKTEILSSSEVVQTSVSQLAKPNQKLSEEEVHSIKMEDSAVEQMI